MTAPAFWNEGWTAALVNHLWQSMVVVGMAWLLALALRKNHARVRYCVWMAASVKFLLPFSLLMTAGEWLPSWVPAQAAQPAVVNATEMVTQPFAGEQFFDAAPMATAGHHANWMAVMLLAVWICGASVVAIRFGHGWLRVWSVRREARPLDLAAQQVPVLCSSTLMEPGIFGILRPVLLLPEGILERLTAEQMRAIMAHEMCHVKRRDNLTFAMHMIVEAMFWFHPAVWWIGARLLEERERACDEVVLATGGGAQAYAEGILNVCKFYVESPLACVAGVTGADLKKRIVRIMTEQVVQRLSLSRKLLLGAAGLAAIAVPMFAGLSFADWSLAQSQAVDFGNRQVKFEVASIKPSSPEEQGDSWNSTGSVFSVKNYDLRRLIREAYGLKSDAQVLGGPAWMDRQRFDIQAKYDDADLEALQTMTGEQKYREAGLALQSLLADRFGLKLQRDTRTVPIYALVIAKGGPKLRPLPPDPGAGSPKTERGNSVVERIGHMTAKAIPITSLAERLTLMPDCDRVVLDRTGLTGDYDLKLDWTEENGKEVPADAQYPGLFTALQEQLGLKLEPQRGPVAVVVVETVSEPVFD